MTRSVAKSQICRAGRVGDCGLSVPLWRETLNWRTPWASAAVSRWQESQSSLAWDIGAEAGVSLKQRDGFPRRYAWVLGLKVPRVVLQLVQRRTLSWVGVRWVGDTYAQMISLGDTGLLE